MCRYCFMLRKHKVTKNSPRTFSVYIRARTYFCGEREGGMEEEEGREKERGREERKGEKGEARERETQKNINRRTHDSFCLSLNTSPR